MVEQAVGVERGFRWRGLEVTRIEGFSDAVFAFAVTLLVISLEVPDTFGELLEKMHGFVAFAISFTLLFVVWYDHYTFFRRYGLKDAATAWLNAALMFVVLFYVYPLKFLFSLLVKLVTRSSLTVHLPGGEVANIIEGTQVPTLMIIFGAGMIAVSFIFAALYFRAYRMRRKLDLNAIEVIDTQASIQTHLIYMMIAILSIAIAIVGGPRCAGLAGWSYWLVGPAQAVNGILMGRRKEKVARQAGD